MVGSDIIETGCASRGINSLSEFEGIIYDVGRPTMQLFRYARRRMTRKSEIAEQKGRNTQSKYSR